MFGYRRLITYILAVTATACEAPEALDTVSFGHLTASIRGGIDVQYQGDGAFYYGRHPRSLGSVLTIRSDGRGTSRGDEIVLYGAITDGETGEFPVMLTADTLATGNFTAFYVRRVADSYEAYTSVSGNVDITRVTREHLEGNLLLRAAWYCTSVVEGSAAPQGSCDPRMLQPAAPTIQITGTFTALPDNEQINR